MLPVRLVQQYGRYLLSADLSPAVMRLDSERAGGVWCKGTSLRINSTTLLSCMCMHDFEILSTGYSYSQRYCGCCRI
jgi:hypothetical protein